MTERQRALLSSNLRRRDFLRSFGAAVGGIAITHLPVPRERFSSAAANDSPKLSQMPTIGLLVPRSGINPRLAGSVAAGLDRVSMNQRLASLEQAKSEFLSVASHELRAPMTVIKGYLTMLEAGSLGDLPTQSKSILPLLIAKADEVNWMVEQMVEAARLEEGRLALKKLPADLVALTDLAIEGVSQLLSKHHLSVEKPKRAIEAEVDPDRFQIVVRNLLSNAAKYSPAGSDIVVRIDRDDGMATISVIDQGVGISEEDQANLFTRFGRIPTSQHVQGTGLGLWLSREIARMHDGDLTVQSAAGTGSTFVLKVPLTQ